MYADFLSCHMQDLSRSTYGTRNCKLQSSAKFNQLITSDVYVQLWLSMVTTLWAFNISKAKDDSGNEIQIDGQYTDAIIR